MGKTENERKKLIKDAKALENNGVFAIVLECIETKLSKKITDTGKIRQITVSEMLAETLRRIDNKESVSSLFVE